MHSKSKINSYLNQQQKLFGNELYLQLSTVYTNKLNEHTQTETANKLEKFYKSIYLCQNCKLGKTRKNFVFGSGDSNADLFLVGEAPGKTEDLIGQPFVGQAGQLLDKILSAIGKNRDNGVFITNVLKCRPPNNRTPLSSEISECQPYLIKQIKLIQPKLIVALGRIAGKTLLKKELTLSEMRKSKYNFFGTPLRITYHPSALLRKPDLKRLAWDDFKWVKNYLEK